MNHGNTLRQYTGISLSPLDRLSRYAVVMLATACITGCVGVGVSIPIGPFGSIGLGMNGQGQVSALIGLGGHVGHVGVGGTVALPLGQVGSQGVAHPAQTGSSQNVPRH